MIIRGMLFGIQMNVEFGFWEVVVEIGKLLISSQEWNRSSFHLIFDDIVYASIMVDSDYWSFICRNDNKVLHEC